MLLHPGRVQVRRAPLCAGRLCFAASGRRRLPADRVVAAGALAASNACRPLHHIQRHPEQISHERLCGAFARRRSLLDRRSDRWRPRAAAGWAVVLARQVRGLDLLAALAHVAVERRSADGAVWEVAQHEATVADEPARTARHRLAPRRLVAHCARIVDAEAQRDEARPGLRDARTIFGDAVVVRSVRPGDHPEQEWEPAQPQNRWGARH
eukprot:644822-Prymnesium_polylepis.3